ncbi:hypothetical protein RJ55_02883 [Drechmeria coniospora]|nr:hypothetical protein RJ55_02883 [Drechmeria coniospora]
MEHHDEDEDDCCEETTKTATPPPPLYSTMAITDWLDQPSIAPAPDIELQTREPAVDIRQPAPDIPIITVTPPHTCTECTALRKELAEELRRLECEKAELVATASGYRDRLARVETKLEMILNAPDRPSTVTIYSGATRHRLRRRRA